MISIVIAGLGVILSIVYYKSVLLTFVSAVVFGFAAYISNKMFKPHPGKVDFSEDEYELDDTFPLWPLTTEGGKPVYAVKETGGRNNASYIVFRSAGRNNAPLKERRLLQRDVRLIYDDKPEIKLYSAMRKYRGNILLSVMSFTACRLVAEVHTPDAIAALSGDQPVKTKRD